MKSNHNNNQDIAMDIVKVNDSNAHVYANLYQGYAAEFSKIIDDKPNENGLFEIYPHLTGNVSGYLLYLNGLPAALTAIDEKSPNIFEICDFYVLPCFRKNKVGKRFISTLLNALAVRGKSSKSLVPNMLFIFGETF